MRRDPFCRKAIAVALGLAGCLLAAGLGGCQTEGAEAPRYYPGPSRLAEPRLREVMRLPADYAVDVDVTWGGTPAHPRRNHTGVFVEWPAGQADLRLAVMDANGYEATFDGERVRVRRGTVIPASSARDSARALARAFRIEQTPYGLYHATGWTYLGQDSSGVYSFARPIPGRVRGAEGELFVEVDAESGLPLLSRGVHTVLGYPARTIEKRYSGWRPASAAGYDFAGAD